MKKQRGTALIIAILLISAVGAVGFSFGRVFLSEYINAKLHESSIVAYYAAESGIEEGFLRYRYSRNAEVPFVNWKMDSVNRTRYNRVNITTPTIPIGAGVDKTTDTPPAGGDQVYYLRMGYAGTANKLPFFGQDMNSDTNLNALDIADQNYGVGDASLTILRDDSYKIDLSNMLSATDKDINLYTKFVGTTLDSASDAKSFFQAKLVIDIDGTGSTVKEYKTIISKNPTATCAILSPVRISSCSDSVIPATQINLVQSLPKDYGWGINNLLATWRARDGFPNVNSNSKVTLTLKPSYYDTKIGIVSTDCSVSSSSTCHYDSKTVIPGPYTIVSSVGYYKGVYRTIEANIDRQSGSLYDLYDYVIYKAK
ncbi:MAG: hypothetical protein WCI57_02350 [Candidatus Berkelbacteria bacterium]